MMDGDDSAVGRLVIDRRCFNGSHLAVELVQVGYFEGIGAYLAVFFRIGALLSGHWFALGAAGEGEEEEEGDEGGKGGKGFKGVMAFKGVWCFHGLRF